MPVILGDYWSDAKCMEVGSVVLQRGQTRVLDCITVPVTQSILDAFSSHGHNVGEANTCASRAMGLLNTSQHEAACDALAHKPDGTPAWSFVKAKAGKRNAAGAGNTSLCVACTTAAWLNESCAWKAWLSCGRGTTLTLAHGGLKNEWRAHQVP